MKSKKKKNKTACQTSLRLIVQRFHLVHILHKQVNKLFATALSERARERAISEPLKRRLKGRTEPEALEEEYFDSIHFYLLIRLNVKSGYDSFPMAIELPPATHEMAIFLALCETNADKTRSISL